MSSTAQLPTYSEADIKAFIAKLGNGGSANKENVNAGSLKRSYDTAKLATGPITVDDDDEDSDSSSDGEIIIKENADQMRRKITSVGYHRFMNQHGKDKGMSSDTFVGAARFFQKREANGLPMPKKRKTAAPLSEKSANAKAVKGTAGGKKDTAPAAAPVSTAHIELPGEKEDAVEIYDSCDDIRKKIAAHFRKTNVTQAALCRELLAQLHGPKKPKSIQSAQLAKFRSYRGAMTGNTSTVYYAAYVYFEKERLAAGREKSNHREDMEHAWGGEGGVDTKRNLNNVGLWCAQGSVPVMNDLGRFEIVRR